MMNKLKEVLDRVKSWPESDQAEPSMRNRSRAGKLATITRRRRNWLRSMKPIAAEWLPKKKSKQRSELSDAHEGRILYARHGRSP
jgi:hypothetical protein